MKINHSILIIAILYSNILNAQKESVYIKDDIKRLRAFVGLHISGDAEMYYIGPSFQVGADYRLKKRLSFSPYFHYYYRRINRIEPGGQFENGKFRTLTAVLLVQGNFGKNPDIGFFIAGGIALQNWRDRYFNNLDGWDFERTTLLPAIRFGHSFALKKRNLTVEINTTGPYAYGDSNSSVVEIFTQVSLGCRLIL